MGWVTGYLLVGFLVGAIGKLYMKDDTVGLLAELVTFVLFCLGWPIVLFMVLTHTKKG